MTLWWYLNQKILNPANEALHEECLPASLPQLVPPSCRLLLPSGAQGAPHHLKAFGQAPPSVGLLSPLLLTLFGYFQVLSSESFPESQDEPGSSVFMCILLMSCFTWFINGFI